MQVKSKELRALIGTLDAGRQNGIIASSIRAHHSVKLRLQKRRATKDAGGAQGVHSFILCVLQDSPSQAESPHSLAATLNVNGFSWGCRGLQCLYFSQKICFKTLILGNWL